MGLSWTGVAVTAVGALALIVFVALVVREVPLKIKLDLEVGRPGKAGPARQRPRPEPTPPAGSGTESRRG